MRSNEATLVLPHVIIDDVVVALLFSCALTASPNLVPRPGVITGVDEPILGQFQSTELRAVIHH
ncbi:hypothetical protein [Escherichia coli]|uniref:hypothetical protein n=1 Tax=Escherichia coli TaxID=562 RepID=UPI002284561F|nr:hypothetical protein [Escherichia coli]MCY9497638.1 hypothetical protein [Escherichia coli]